MLVLAFQVGSESVGLDIRRVHAVVPRVRLQPVSGSPAWLAGAFVYRGVMVPVVDLCQLIGAGECPPELSSRIVLIHRDDSSGTANLLGLLAAHVADIREIDGDLTAAQPLSGREAINLGPTLVDGTTIMRLLDPDRLFPRQMDSGVLV
ncbi:MAG: chemotaxis protein CheW [Gemmataceae bacterium]|nr:chemotaxis protein CheW [Gemmataceae bacterium]